MSDVMLRAEGVRFAWGDHRVLQDFSLEVKRGSVACLMGMNGCGKSTFLDCVLGENKPAAGTIEIDGRDTAKLRAPERARLLAYVPQLHERTFPYTVEHLVLMGRTAYQSEFGSVDDYDRKLADQALRACGIERLRDRACTALSGGEMQMVLLARALVQNTPLVVLDEPTAHLDFRNELLFLETVERLVRRSAVTVLMATHAPNQAFHLAAAGLDVRVALMSKGCVALCGRPEDVLTPETLLRYFGVHAGVVQLSAAGGGADARASAARGGIPGEATGISADATEGGRAFSAGMRSIVPLATSQEEKGGK